VRRAVAGTLPRRSRRATPVAVPTIEGTTVRLRHDGDFRKEAATYCSGISRHASVVEHCNLQEGD
jgi:hypothetical protein